MCVYVCVLWMYLWLCSYKVLWKTLVLSTASHDFLSFIFTRMSVLCVHYYVNFTHVYFFWRLEKGVQSPGIGFRIVRQYLYARIWRQNQEIHSAHTSIMLWDWVSMLFSISRCQLAVLLNFITYHYRHSFDPNCLDSLDLEKILTSIIFFFYFLLILYSSSSWAWSREEGESSSKVQNEVASISTPNVKSIFCHISCKDVAKTLHHHRRGNDESRKLT